MQADLCNFTFQILSSKGEMLNVFLPQPNSLEVKRLAPILGRVFTELRSQTLDTIVLLQDWELLVDEVVEKLNQEKSDNIKKALDTFFDRSLASATIIDSNGLKIQTLNEDETSLFKGTLLFILSLYRYSLKASLKSDLRDFFTELTCLEWQKQLTSGKEVNTAAKGKKRVKV